ncbi:MAG: peptidoglycan-binding protein [Alphaproteobacteria bacterium]|nr:peptidoglycan-binding protein [Alphaproteobacteria bacterium]
MLTEILLRSIFPAAPDEDIKAFLTVGMQRLDEAGIIHSLTRLCFFLAQVGHESDGLTCREERLSYSAEGLMKTWPSRFPTLETARKYARKPEALAEFVYGGRADLGNTQDGDGYRFRGRGYIQLTGRSNYRETGRITGLDLVNDPDLASRAENAVWLACAFWDMNRLNAVCDRGDFKALTAKINGPRMLHLQDRLVRLETVQRILGATQTPTVPARPRVEAPKPRPKPVSPAGPQTPSESLASPVVLAAQNKLTRLGYYLGAIDGIYNQVLRDALWAFQSDEDLPLTGRLDQRTRSELNV